MEPLNDSVVKNPSIRRRKRRRRMRRRRRRRRKRSIYRN
jgi:hypothetical protein